MEKIEYHIIVVDNSITGITRRESCIFHGTKRMHGCKLVDDIECRYSGTEIRIPEKCPLRKGEVIIKVTAISRILEKE